MVRKSSWPDRKKIDYEAKVVSKFFDVSSVAIFQLGNLCFSSQEMFYFVSPIIKT